MARVTIQVSTDDRTDVKVSEESLQRELDKRPDDEAGRLLDEAVRRVRAALGLDDQPERAS